MPARRKLDSKFQFSLSLAELVIHFTLIADGEHRIFGAELFDSQGEMLGYAPIVNSNTVGAEDWDVPWFVEWKDKGNRFYVLNMEGDPIIQIVNIEYSIDKQSPAPRNHGSSR